MNIYRLKQKLRIIMDVHELINKDQLECLENAKLGIHEDILYHQVFKFDFLTYQDQYNNLKDFIDKLQKHSIAPFIVLQQENNMNNSEYIDSEFITLTHQQRNKEQFKEILYNRAIYELLLPKKVLIHMLQQLQVEYFVAQNASTQLRYFFTTGYLGGIVAETSFLEHCHGFKELNHLIISIEDEAFEWVDIKLLTAKSQLSLDSLSELYAVYHYCQLTNTILFNQEYANQCSINRFQKEYAQLSRRESTDLLYSLTQQFFAGKLSLEQRISKNSQNLENSKEIAQFIKQQKDQPYIDIQLECIQREGTVYPSDVLAFQINGIGIINNIQVLKPSFEINHLKLYPQRHLILEKLSIEFAHGQLIKKPNLVQCHFKEFLAQPTLQRSIIFYYNKLHLTSRKNSLEVGETVNTSLNQNMINLNSNLRFLHFFSIIHLDQEKGSLFGSALQKVKYFEQMFLYLYLLDSPIKHVLYQEDNIDQRVLLLLRVFCLFNSSSGQIDTFCQLANILNNHFSEIYDHIVISYSLELNQRQAIEAFINVGKSNQFKKIFYRCHEEFLPFLLKKIDKSVVSFNLSEVLDGWNDLLKMVEYINMKQGMKFPQVHSANEITLQKRSETNDGQYLLGTGQERYRLQFIKLQNIFKTTKMNANWRSPVMLIMARHYKKGGSQRKIILLKPMISAQPHLQKFKSKFEKDKNEQQMFQSTMTLHQNESTMTKGNVPNRVQKQMNLNKEILRRLGLLSTQAKRAMDMEKLTNRALKIKSEADSIPAFNKKTLQIVAKQIKQQEQAALQQHRCTTSASAAARMALTYQESKLNEILSERRAYTTSGASRRNRPKTRETQTNVKQFYLELASLQLENQDHIKEEEQKLWKQMFEIKEDLGKCKKQLLDYNDEIEIALTQEIIGQVIEYRNSLLLKGQ